MPVTIVDEGSGNTIVAPPEFIEHQSGTIIFKGNHSSLVIGSHTAMRGGQIQVCNGSCVMIGDQCLLGFIDIFANSGATISIGNNVGFTWTVKVHAHEKGYLKIGNGCLIAKDTLITISDMHSIVDVATGERVNPPKDIEIGDNVWLAESVRVMKGVSIGNGSIIGTCSLVTKNIPAQCLALGVPASVQREGVTWRHDLI